jgi:alpha-tubulin suppressor-like RCC1 family protein
LLTNDGDIHVYTFGSNEFGQLGNNSQYSRNEPRKLNIEKQFTEIASSNSSNVSIAVSTDGIHYVWGRFFRKIELPQGETEF